MKKINWKNNFKEGKQLVLATASLVGNPNANVVISLGFIEDKLLVADCMMETTIKNLKANPKVSIVSGVYKINGVAKIYDSGEIFDICTKRSAKVSPDRVKNAILVDIKDIFDLYKASIIN
jgi:uncharacterized pyridoxamine 5'-phosphate oxidase family protein